MPRITYIQPNGEPKTVDVPAGTTAMEAAVDNDVAGIVAECGGACSCATCHVYVDPEWVDKLPRPEPQEDDSPRNALLGMCLRTERQSSYR